jgi:ATP synthase protein I
MRTDHVSALLRGALVPTLVVAAPVTGASAVLAGRPGALGALVGAAVVVVFSGAGLLAVRAARGAAPSVLLVVALGSFLARVILFGLALQAANAIEDLDTVLHRGATVVGVVSCVIAWMAGEIWAFRRLRVPTYDLDDASASTTGGAP